MILLIILVVVEMILVTLFAVTFYYKQKYDIEVEQKKIYDEIQKQTDESTQSPYDDGPVITALPELQSIKHFVSLQDTGQIR